MLIEADVLAAIEFTLQRSPSEPEQEAITARARAADYDRWQLVQELRGSSESVHLELGRSTADHPYLIHRARVCLMATMLPAARRILDLGGANAPLCDAGYSHPFDELVIVDLPPEDRHDDFAGRLVADRQSPLGPVRVAYTSMTDLSMFADSSFDLVWSGQSIEHITVDQARATYRESLRVLDKDGWFCLDTPNRLVTSVHAQGGMIHPEHKHEYEPDELIGELEAAGFEVVTSLGVCDMPLTMAQGSIDYRDFVLGAGITTVLDSAYIQFHACRPKPL